MVQNKSKYQFLYIVQSGKCAISGMPIPSYESRNHWFKDRVDLHHRCHKTKWREKKYPLFINSILNLCLVSHNEHMKNPSALTIKDYQAEKIEALLNEVDTIARWANNPFILGTVDYTLESIKDIMEG